MNKNNCSNISKCNEKNVRNYSIYCDPNNPQCNITGTCNSVQIVECLPDPSLTQLSVGDSVIVMPEGEAFILTNSNNGLVWVEMGTLKGKPGKSVTFVDGENLPSLEDYIEGDSIIFIPNGNIYTYRNCEWILIGNICSDCDLIEGTRIEIIERNETTDLPLPIITNYNIGDIIIVLPSGNIYKKTNENIWNLEGNIKGESGVKGEKGQVGERGSIIDILENVDDLPLEGYLPGDIIIKMPEGIFYTLSQNNIWQNRGIIKGIEGNDPISFTVFDNPLNTPPPLPGDYNNGDIVLLTPSGDIYTYYNGEWLYGGSIRGEKGDPGQGGTWIEVYNNEDNTPPDLNEPNNYKEGDIVLVLPSGNLYVLTSVSPGVLQWEQKGSLKGDTGLPGQNSTDEEGFFTSTSSSEPCNLSIITPKLPSSEPENISIAVVPKNNGSFQLSSQRNCRGINSVDLQIQGINSTTNPINTQVASGNYSFLGNGIGSKIEDDYSCILGGRENKIILNHEIYKNYNFIGGGIQNEIWGYGCANLGGGGNIISGVGNFNSSGTLNIIEGDCNVNSNGRQNKILNTNSDIENNTSNVIINGNLNTVRGKNNTNLSGFSNYIGNTRPVQSSVNINGNNNIINGDFSTIINGERNRIDGNYSTIFNGKEINISSISSININGENNNITGNTSFSLNSKSSNINGPGSGSVGGENSTTTEQATNAVTLGGRGLIANIPNMVTVGEYNKLENESRPNTTDYDGSSLPYHLTFGRDIGTYRNARFVPIENNSNRIGNVLFSVGKGTESNRNDMFFVNDKGLAWARRSFACSYADIAEIYICNDKEKPKNGTLMSIDDEGIVHAYEKNKYERVIGVVSSDPMIIGNFDGNFTKYLRDENTGLIIKDKNGNPIIDDKLNICDDKEYNVIVGICGRVLMHKKYLQYIPDDWISYDIKMSNFVMVQIR